MTGNPQTSGETPVLWDPHPDRSTYPWYALRVKSNKEKTVCEALMGKGYEGFLPLYRSRRRWSDRYKDIDLPLFPGYVFCRFDIVHRLPLLTIPSVVHVVGLGKTPLPVDDQEITAIQTLVRSGLSLQPWPFLEVGQRVMIDEGPLHGVEGVVLDTKCAQHLIVSITLLQRSVAVAIERRWARPIGSERTAHSGTSVKHPKTA